MFFWRKDGGVIARGRRRIRSERAAVFAEFSFLAPFLVLLISAMIELVSFWDAKVMANHAAWTVGRIAQVRCVEEQKAGSTKLYGMAFGEEYNVLKTKVRSSALSLLLRGVLSGTGAADLMKTRQDVVSLFMMSTCGMGGYGTYWYEGKGKGGLLKHLFAHPMITLSDYLNGKAKLLAEVFRKLGTNFIAQWFPLRSGFFSVVTRFLEMVLNKLIDKILQPVLNWIEEMLKKLVKWVEENMIHLLNRDVAEDDAVWDRMFSRVCAAKARMAGTNYACAVTVDKPTGSALFQNTIWSAAGDGRMYRFTYPQAAMQSDPRTAGWVKNAQGWPINGQKQSLVKVTLDWPFSSGWVFPVVSGFGKIDGNVVTRGLSLVYPQPAIMNEHLLSEGAAVFEKGGVTEANSKWGELNVGNYLKMAAFAVDYRMGYEKIKYPRVMGVVGPVEPLLEILANNDLNNQDYRNTHGALMYYRIPAIAWKYNEYLFWKCNKTRHRYFTYGGTCGTGWYGHITRCNAGITEYWTMFFLVPDKTEGRLINQAREYEKRAAWAKAVPDAEGPQLYSQIWPDAPARYRAVVRPNLYSLIRLSYATAEEADAMVRTNNLFSGNMKSGKSLLGAQAAKFSQDMQKYREHFAKMARGDKEEIISGMQDVLTDEQIRSLADPDAQFKKVQEQWDRARAQMDALYNKIDDNIPMLAGRGQQSEDKVNGFVNGLAGRFSQMIQEAKQYAVDHPEDESAGATLEAHLRQALSGGANAAAFRDSHAQLIAAMRAFQESIAKSHKLENDYASLIGGGTADGGRMLEPRDIGEGGTADAPDDTPTSSPKSGNDGFPGGEAWIYESGRWKVK